MGFWWWNRNKSIGNNNVRIGERVKRVQVNLWDDYKQEPEYSITNPTTITIEDDEITHEQRAELREVIFHRCLAWKISGGFDGVGFSLNPTRSEVIDVIGLTEPYRKSLFDSLKKNENGISDVKINWVMES